MPHHDEMNISAISKIDGNGEDSMVEGILNRLGDTTVSTPSSAAKGHRRQRSQMLDIPKPSMFIETSFENQEQIEKMDSEMNQLLQSYGIETEQKEPTEDKPQESEKEQEEQSLEFQ